MSLSADRKWTILGQDPDVLRAMWANIVSWVVSTFVPAYLPRLLPPCDYYEGTSSFDGGDATRCISIGRPGGLEQLRVVSLQSNVMTKGYNVVDGSPFINRADIPNDCVELENMVFSVNYADCCIRWGLYESAKQFVGWPIVPGFDVAGVIQADHQAQGDNTFRRGDRVFGCTLFGAYSSRIAIPAVQLRKIPPGISFAQAASLPAVSLTALYALHLAGHYPTTGNNSNNLKRNNQAILIHSAAGGVGSMAVQMARILGLGPIVGVVGRTHKVEAAKALGCDYVIDKSNKETTTLWHQAARISPDGYSAILDANGVSTLAESYNHLCATGRLVVFGFHSNLPVGQAALNPLTWIQIGLKMSSMPKFDPMDLVVSNKAVMGFNLSFFANETKLVSTLFDQICQWLIEKKLQCPRVVEMDGMEQIGEAHQLIMSGQSIGKIVIRSTTSTTTTKNDASSVAVAQ